MSLHFVAGQAGPVLPEQPPTKWGACSSDLTGGALTGVIGVAELVNDFVAVGFGLPALDLDDIVTLHDGSPNDAGPIACTGAGGLVACLGCP